MYINEEWLCYGSWCPCVHYILGIFLPLTVATDFFSKITVEVETLVHCSPSYSVVSAFANKIVKLNGLEGVISLVFSFPNFI